MKKKRNILFSVILFLLILSGCSKKELEADEVGSLFVNHFIYYKEEEAFKENFVEGDLLSKQLTLMTATFEDTFSSVFDSVVPDLTETEKEKISSDLMIQVREKSHYTYSTKEVDKETIEVEYDINGFDYSNLVELTLEGFFKELMKEGTSTSGNTKKGLLESFDQALEKGKAVSEPTKITLVFKQNKQQWELADNQDDELEQMLLTFISGASDKKAYDKKMEEMLEKSIKKATDIP